MPSTAAADVVICLRFFSRLPLPATAREAALGTGGLPAATAMVPVAGALIGIGPALVLGGAYAAGLPANVGALLAVAALVGLTGALHEDGLADCADGFGGGRTRERRLAIMRDSRIGTFGACAVGFSLLLRAACLAAMAPAPAAAVLIATAAVSRTLCLLPLLLLPPARADGMGAGAAAIGRRPYAVSLAIGTAIGLAPAGVGVPLTACILAEAAAGAAALLACLLARRMIGGQTGDVAGSAQQAAEIAALIVLAR